MIPRAENAHWLAAAVALFFGLILIAELIVGPEVFHRRKWRAYLFPSLVIVSNVDHATVRVARAHVDTAMPAHALETHPDVGLHVLDDVTQVQGVVRVG